MTILTIVIVGILAGAIAGLIVEGHGFGLFGDMIIGIAGAFIGGEILPTVGIMYGFWGLVFMSTLGAAILLVVTRMVRYVTGPQRKSKFT